MAQKSKSPGRATLLWPLLLLLLGALALAALYYLGATRPLQSRELSALPPEGKPLSLRGEREVYTAPEEDAADAPQPSPEEDRSYGEVLVQGEGMTVYRVQGKRYTGVLAVIDDPRRLYVGTLAGYGMNGLTLEGIMDASGAVLGVNGGGFQDANGQGNGSVPIGVVMVDGQFRYGGPGGYYDVCAFDGDGRLYVGPRTGAQLQELGVQHAVCYGPALIIDGEMQQPSSLNLEPRTAVGQREDGSVLLLVVEGRQVGSLGVSLPELAAIMASYGAVNATNLDGGASSVMLYDHTMLNRPNGLAGMRGIPSAVLVRPAGEGAEE